MKLLVNLIGAIFILQTSCAQERAYDQTKVSSKIETSIDNTYRGIKSKTGIIYYVEKDNRTLTAYKNDKIIWQTDIISVCGKPLVGSPEIRYIKLERNIISVTFGKHSYANVDINNGKTTFGAAD